MKLPPLTIEKLIITSEAIMAILLKSQHDIEGRQPKGDNLTIFMYNIGIFLTMILCTTEHKNSDDFAQFCKGLLQTE